MDKKNAKTGLNENSQNSKVKQDTNLGRKATSGNSDLAKPATQKDNLNIQKGVNNTAIDSDMDDQDQDDDVF